MCGITGFLTRTALAPDAVAQVTAMTRTLAHRGPDSEGIWADRAAGVALGHRRLAILDLSPAGHQPMASASGRYVMAFNGEIYNFLDLRRDLERSEAAPEFKGHSDTEIMLACFERWGVTGSVSRFNGMFAFAVWDRRERTLHLARDPIGEKPLYYSWAANLLLFGSELKALRAHPDCPCEIDRTVLALYLMRGYVPAPYSIYRGIFKLPPGTMLSVNAVSQLSSVERYWSFKQVAEGGCAHPFVGPAEEAEKQLEQLLSDATRIRMIADVPLGAFLSGGIDSSLTVALMQSQSTKPVRTFTIGFHESEFNEAAAAKKVANHLGTDHTEWYITPQEARAVVPLLPALYDEPFADSSQIPTFLVSALARKHVTVSLSGDGGDELFGGYRHYTRINAQWRRLARAPAPVRALLAKALGPLTSDGDGPLAAIGAVLLPGGPRRHKLRKLAALVASPDPSAFYDTYHCNWWEPPVLAGRDRDTPIAPAAANEWPCCSDFIHHMMAVDTLVFLPDDILVKVDRASMGVSLESRIPLLDSRVVEFAWRLPLYAKVGQGVTKRILRRILYRHVPPDLVQRPKRGFAVPIAGWLREPLREWAGDLLATTSLDSDGFLATRAIQQQWKEHLSGTCDHSGALWAVLMFQAWLKDQAQSTTFPPGGITALAPEYESSWRAAN